MQFERRPLRPAVREAPGGQRLGGGGGGGGRGPLLVRGRGLQEEAPQEQDHLHHLPAARAREGVREEPLPGRVQQGGAGDEGQPAGGQGAGGWEFGKCGDGETQVGRCLVKRGRIIVGLN